MLAAVGAASIDVPGAFASDPAALYADGHGPKDDGAHPNRQGALPIARTGAACLLK